MSRKKLRSTRAEYGSSSGSGIADIARNHKLNTESEGSGTEHLNTNTAEGSQPNIRQVKKYPIRYPSLTSKIGQTLCETPSRQSVAAAATLTSRKQAPRLVVPNTNTAEESQKKKQSVGAAATPISREQTPRPVLGGIEVSGERRTTEEQEAKGRGPEYWIIYVQYGKEFADECFGNAEALGGKFI